MGRYISLRWLGKQRDKLLIIFNIFICINEGEIVMNEPVTENGKSVRCTLAFISTLAQNLDR